MLLRPTDSAPELATEIPDLPRIVGSRNILIHGYAMVDDAIVWQVLTERLPELGRLLSELLASLDDRS